MDRSTLPARIDALRTVGIFPDTLLEAFVAYLRDSPDASLFRMNPIGWAARQSVDPRVAIDLFLYAAHAGLLDATWSLVCPGCGAFLRTPGGLRGLAETGWCGLCRIGVPPSLDDNVEISFTVSAAVRRIRFHDPDRLADGADCVALWFSSTPGGEGSPRESLPGMVRRTARVGPGESYDFEETLEPGRWIVMAPDSHAVAHLVVGKGPDTVQIDLLDGITVPDEVEVATGPVRVRVLNRTRRAECLVLLPDPSPPLDARACAMPPMRMLPYLDGRRLLTTQSFLDLFRADSVPASSGLELKSLTLVFTDLTRSTELYERIGDLRAFERVQRHFGLLRSAVAAHGGAVVKTIGDAVMATFTDPAPAMAAAMRMRADVRELGESLKVGLHTGPCIAVSLNDQLDYFGRTVNIAARVQTLAGEGEIVCTRESWESTGVREAAAGLHAVSSAATLRGIAGTVPVMRLS